MLPAWMLLNYLKGQNPSLLRITLEQVVRELPGSHFTILASVVTAEIARRGKGVESVRREARV